MPHPTVKPPKHNFQFVTPESKTVINGSQSFMVTGTLYRERNYGTGGPGAAAFSVVGGTPPNGGGLVNTSLGGLMLANNSVVILGKWCVYLSIEPVRNYVTKSADTPDKETADNLSLSTTNDSTSDANTSITRVPIGVIKRYFVGKYESEREAKANMEMVVIYCLFKYIFIYIL